MESSSRKTLLSFILPVHRSSGFLEESVQKLLTTLPELVGPGAFEVILVPNPIPPSPQNVDMASTFEDRMNLKACESLALRYRSQGVRCIPHREGKMGKWAALRTGFNQIAPTSRFIFISDSDLPFDLKFLSEAMEAFAQGAHLVLGNRRLSGSMSMVPNGLQAKFFLRSILGQAFNAAARLIIPSIGTKDSQAGIKAIHVDLARVAFEKMKCPTFFGDIELILTARALHTRCVEVPVTLYVNDSKSSVSFMKDTFTALKWLFKIRHLNKVQYYESSTSLRDFSSRRLEQISALPPQQHALRLVHSSRR